MLLKQTKIVATISDQRCDCLLYTSNLSGTYHTLAYGGARFAGARICHLFKGEWGDSVSYTHLPSPVRQVEYHSLCGQRCLCPVGRGFHEDPTG